MATVERLQPGQSLHHRRTAVKRAAPLRAAAQATLRQAARHGALRRGAPGLRFRVVDVWMRRRQLPHADGSSRRVLRVRPERRAPACAASVASDGLAAVVEAWRAVVSTSSTWCACAGVACAGIERPWACAGAHPLGPRPACCSRRSLRACHHHSGCAVGAVDAPAATKRAPCGPGTERASKVSVGTVAVETRDVSSDWRVN